MASRTISQRPVQHGQRWELVAEWSCGHQYHYSSPSNPLVTFRSIGSPNGPRSSFSWLRGASKMTSDGSLSRNQRDSAVSLLAYLLPNWLLLILEQWSIHPVAILTRKYNHALGLLPFLLGRALPCHGGNYLANKPLFIWPYRQIPTISTEYVVFLVPDVVSMGICLHFFFLFFVFPRHISGSQMAENVEPNYTLSDTT